MSIHLLAFLPDAVPSSWYDVLLLPFFLSGIGVVIYAMGRNAEFKMLGHWKWWCMAPMTLAVLLGFRPMSYLFDVVYRASAEEYGRKMIFAHYGALGVPLACIVGVVAWHFMDRRPETFR